MRMADSLRRIPNKILVVKGLSRLQVRFLKNKVWQSLITTREKWYDLTLMLIFAQAVQISFLCWNISLFFRVKSFSRLHLNTHTYAIDFYLWIWITWVIYYRTIINLMLCWFFFFNRKNSCLIYLKLARKDGFLLPSE